MLAFLHVDSRRVICSPATFHPNNEWVVAQAASLLQEAELPVRFLVRDKNYKFTRRFDEVFEEAGVSVEPTSPRCPHRNAFVEQWIGSIKGRCFNRFFNFGLSHLDYLAGEYVRYYTSCDRIPGRKTSR